MANITFAKQLTSYQGLQRIKAIGHPAAEGFEQHYNHENGKYAGYVATVNNFGISYRAFPSKLNTGQLFDSLETALGYLADNENNLHSDNYLLDTGK